VHRLEKNVELTRAVPKLCTSRKNRRSSRDTDCSSAPIRERGGAVHRQATRGARLRETACTDREQEARPQQKLQTSATKDGTQARFTRSNGGGPTTDAKYGLAIPFRPCPGGHTVWARIQKINWPILELEALHAWGFFGISTRKEHGCAHH
jgi:hypothetical protein